MSVLLLAEVNNGELAMDATAKAVTAATKLGDVTVLACGASAAAAGAAAAAGVGAMAVPVHIEPGTGPPLPAGWAMKESAQYPGRFFFTDGTETTWERPPAAAAVPPLLGSIGGSSSAPSIERS